MKEKREMAIGFVGLVISIICLGISLFYGGKASLYEQICFLSLKSAPVLSETASQLQGEMEKAEKGAAVCFFREENEQWLTNEDLNRRVKGSVTLACGNTQLLFPESSVLMREDEEGCLLGEELAYELFGNKEAAGGKLLLDGRELEVRGILQEEPKAIVVQASMDAEASDEAFAFLAVRLKDGQTAEEVQSDFANHYGIQGRIIASSFYEIAAKIGGSLLYIGVFLSLFPGIAKGIWKYRSRPAVVLTLFLLILASGALIKEISPYFFPISKGNLPSQWSDFSWYSAWYEQKAESFEGLMRIEKGNVLFYLWKISGKAMGFGMISLLTFLLCRKQIETDAPVRAAAYSVSLSALWLAVAGVTGRYGIDTGHFIQGWGLFTIYIWAVWVMKRIEKGEAAANEGSIWSRKENR